MISHAEIFGKKSMYAIARNFVGYMFICRNAERVRERLGSGNPCCKSCEEQKGIREYDLSCTFHVIELHYFICVTAYYI